MIRYVFSENRPVILNNLDKADPQKIGEELEKIAGSNQGMLKADAILDAAKSRKSALHQHFEWDDAKAAHAHRLMQARHLVRSISIEDVDTEEETPAFVSVSDKGGRSYRSIGEIQESPRLQRLILESAKRDLRSFKERYRRFSDLFEPNISTALDRIEEETNDQPSV
jgi:hypothetical protein